MLSRQRSGRHWVIYAAVAAAMFCIGSSAPAAGEQRPGRSEGRIEIQRAGYGARLMRGTVVVHQAPLQDAWIDVKVDKASGASVYPSRVLIPAGSTESDTFTIYTDPNGKAPSVRVSAASQFYDLSDIDAPVQPYLDLGYTMQTVAMGSIVFLNPGISPTSGWVSLVCNANGPQPFALTVCDPDTFEPNAALGTVSPTSVTVPDGTTPSDPFTLTLAPNATSAAVCASGSGLILPATVSTSQPVLEAPQPQPGPIIDPWS